MTDAELVTAAKGGDQTAFEALVRNHQRNMYSLALRHVGNPEDALDITQEAFFRAYKGLPKFQGNSSFSTWLYRLTVNICIDHMRKKKRGTALPFSALGDTDNPDAIPEIPDLRYLPENAAELAELQEALSKALETLSEEHRLVFILRGVHGLPYQTIAEILDLEAGTVKSRISRARENLRKELIRQGNFWPNTTSK